jgi:toxin-antitoxin system PIN domain toxin
LIFVDANLLLYAYDRASPVHEPARRWLTEAFSGTEPLGFSWPTVLAFLRITTNPKIFKNPFSIEEATSIVDDWFSQPSAKLVQAGENHWTILRGLLLDSGSSGPLVMDAHIAALASEHGMVIATRDGDFAMFPDVQSLNPLAAP